MLKGVEKRIWQRNYNRKRRIGVDWRQVYYDQDGICQRCGNPFGLEFHEYLDLDTDSNGFIKFELVCNCCHICYHNYHFKDNARASMLAEDIQREIDECGNLAKWKVKYNIKEVNGTIKGIRIEPAKIKGGENAG